MQETIFLIGPRACGKTTVGEKLAEKLGIEHIDTDQCLLEETGMTVADIVAAEGWDGFRRREGEILRQVAQPGRVVATGGGMVLAAANRDFMKKSGIVVYLHAPTDILAKRLSINPENAKRPSLTGKSMLEEIEEVLQEREPLYREASHYLVAADRELNEILAEIAILVDVVSPGVNQRGE